ncbi:MAG: glycosyltransferase family 9 protein, partial [Phycisphaerales bacterium JB039]
QPVLDFRLHIPPDAPPLPEPLPGARYALLAPTSRWPAKRWPADRFRRLAEALLGQGAVDAVAVVGGPGEHNQCAPLADLAARDRRVVDLVGQTSVGGLMRLVQSAAVVIANDSAALHIAVGFDRPIVALYGPTDVNKVGPYGRAADVLQKLAPGDDLNHKRPENVRLMERVGVEEVLDAAIARAQAPQIPDR